MKTALTFLFTAVLLLKPFELFPQDQKEKLILLHGAVIDAGNQKALANVHYLVNGSVGGVSNAEGKFSLFLTLNDTVRFSYLGYSSFDLVLSDTLLGNSYIAAIFLESDTLNVGEVIVIPRLGDLRSEFRTLQSPVSQEYINAQNNITTAVHQGLTNSATLGDPQTNFELLRRKQVVTASEMGGIPSEQMFNFNAISLLPAVIYLMSNGLPEKSAPPEPHISPREMEKMIELYKFKYKH